jgi:hypothetical protein
MKYCTNKEINNIVRDLVRHGWLFQWGGKHGRLQHPQGHPVITVPKSPSDRRASLNFSCDIKRAIRSSVSAT